MRRGGDDRIIRASRAIEHPGRNLKPPSRIGAAQRAAENNIIRLGDRLVDKDRQTKPWMPPIQELAKTGPVGVIKLGCTTRAVVIRRSVIYPRSNTSVVSRPIPTHTSLPSCSRPSRTSPSGGPQVGPSLTAAARDGRTIVRAGMEEWLRRGPNKRMTPSRRVKCSQTRYSDPKPSTVHQTGASSKAGKPKANQRRNSRW